MDRDFRLDCVRVCALFLILVCHLAQPLCIGGGEVIHDVCAYIGNSIFFILSGLLLGRAWQGKGCPQYDMRFLARRFVKIWIPFLFFIIPYILWLACMHGVSVQSSVMNVFMLSWFAKLPAAGHLWFVTAILMLYLTMVILSRVRCFRKIALGIIVVVLALIGDLCMHKVGIRQTYLMPLLAAGSISFLFADKAITSKKLVCWSAILFVALLGCCVLTKGKLFSSYWVAVVAAVGVMRMIITVSSDMTHVGLTAIVSFLSRISFPVYLVHCVFLSDVVLPFRKMIANDFLFSLGYFMFAIALGSVIHYLASLVERRVFVR